MCRSYSQYEIKHSTLPTNACSKLESKTFDSCAKWTLPWICSTTINKIEQRQLISFCSLCYRLWILSVYHSRHLLVQSQQWKLQKYVRNLLKVNNKDTRTTPLRSFWCFYCYLSYTKNIGFSPDIYSYVLNQKPQLYQTIWLLGYMVRRTTLVCIFTCSKLTIGTLEQGMKYVQS